MSINAMTNAALGRRADFAPVNKVPQDLAEIAEAAGNTPAPVPPSPAPPTQPAPPPSGVNTTLQTLTTYIPTEVLTLYVAAVAALGPLTFNGHDEVRWWPFWTFLVGTPLITWIAFATKVKSAGRPVPVNPKHWPMWEMSAAMIAFAVWAFALPDTPFRQLGGYYSQGLAGLAVMLVSYGLGALGPLMQRSLPSSLGSGRSA